MSCPPIVSGYVAAKLFLTRQSRTANFLPVSVSQKCTCVSMDWTSRYMPNYTKTWCRPQNQVHFKHRLSPEFGTRFYLNFGYNEISLEYHVCRTSKNSQCPQNQHNSFRGFDRTLPLYYCKVVSYDFYPGNLIGQHTSKHSNKRMSCRTTQWATLSFAETKVLNSGLRSVLNHVSDRLYHLTGKCRKLFKFSAILLTTY